jgi:hypothetical protein
MVAELTKQLRQLVERGRQAPIKNGMALAHNIGGTGHYAFVTISWLNGVTMSPMSTVEKSVVSAVVETLEKLYGEPLKQLDALIKATSLPVYRDPKSGALLWVDVRELRLRFTLSVNKLEEIRRGDETGQAHVYPVQEVRR